MRPARRTIQATLVLLIAAAAGCASQRSFATPQDAADALAQAAGADDRALARKLFGPRAAELRTADPDQDRQDLRRFARAIETKREVRINPDNSATILVGEDAWPFAVPLVQRGDAWRFNTDAGIDELTTRRIGRNEINTIAACLTLIDAQREYHAQDRDGDTVREFADRLMSTPGKKDGLYWDAGPGGRDPSPIGPEFALAASRTDDSGERLPFHGYRYRVLTGEAGPAGATTDFIVDGNFTRGWAAIAYPDEYAVSGVMSFLVGHRGEIWERDLGPDSREIARNTDRFDSTGWTRVGD
jgi:hypothetical protein